MTSRASGHPSYTELGATMAFDDGRRPGELAARLQADGKVDLHGLYFDFGSATLRAESAPMLQPARPAGAGGGMRRWL